MNVVHTINRYGKLQRFARPASFLSSIVFPSRASIKPAQYVSALAHEVRNPLTTINLSLELLSLTALDEEQKKCLAIIARSSNRIRDLTNTLLLSNQTKETIPGCLFLHELLDEALAIVNDRIMLKNITIYKDYAVNDHSVSVDKEKMTIALSNIILNAIEAMSSEKGELRLVTRSTGELGIIEIHDNGVGISEENLKNIFTPFFTNKPGGMGLGLTATQDILRANQVTVDVRSEEGIETCFILSFGKM
jgi:signal transduction histidine kinase